MVVVGWGFTWILFLSLKKKKNKSKMVRRAKHVFLSGISEEQYKYRSDLVSPSHCHFSPLLSADLPSPPVTPFELSGCVNLALFFSFFLSLQLLGLGLGKWWVSSLWSIALWLVARWSSPSTQSSPEISPPSPLNVFRSSPPATTSSPTIAMAIPSITSLRMASVSSFSDLPILICFRWHFLVRSACSTVWIFWIRGFLLCFDHRVLILFLNSVALFFDWLCLQDGFGNTLMVIGPSWTSWKWKKKGRNKIILFLFILLRKRDNLGSVKLNWLSECCLIFGTWPQIIRNSNEDSHFWFVFFHLLLSYQTSGI